MNMRALCSAWEYAMVMTVREQRGTHSNLVHIHRMDKAVGIGMGVFAMRLLVVQCAHMQKMGT